MLAKGYDNLFVVFQFYNSPIKTKITKSKCGRNVKFQFYNSPIKTVENSVTIGSVTEFQFYNSPIKTWL